ncbi:hypothetical protein LCGC14_0608650 [marine sediment metagenome]|uniref:Uncharacterized protein n=1 Tax=marine sediment metagenome TaxID=412755 RepID=A0A0F9UGV4_9ZZZZ
MVSNMLNVIETAEARIGKAKKMVKERNKLAAKQTEVSAEVTEYDKQIAKLLGVSSLGKNVPGKKRGPKLGTKKIKQNSLVSFIRRSMTTGKEMDVKEIRNAVKRRGYKTHQKNDVNFRSTIGAALRNDSRVKHGRKRGTYILKPAVVTGGKKKSITSKKSVVSKKTDDKSNIETAVAT